MENKINKNTFKYVAYIKKNIYITDNSSER